MAFYNPNNLAAGAVNNPGNLSAHDPWFSPSPTSSGQNLAEYGDSMYGQSQHNNLNNNNNNASMTSNYNYNPYNSVNNNMGAEEDYENEPPLLEELGIRFDHIWAKTEAVTHPLKELQDGILDDADLAGPIFYCLVMGSLLLLSGKVHFGYIYGFSVFGCLGMYALLNLLSDSSVIDIWLTCSVLGYCLLPVICLAGIAVVLKLQSIVGLLLSILAVVWSSHAATRLFLSKMVLQPGAYYYLIAYPAMLLYSAFVLITIF